MRSLEDVEVQNTLTGGWTAGFQIIERERTAIGEVVRLRRVADGVALPRLIEITRVRPCTRRETR